MGAWEKAGYGGTTKKSGGGKLESPANEGNKGWSGPKPGNSSISRKLIDTPMTQGNKGIIKGGGSSNAKAPRD